MSVYKKFTVTVTGELADGGHGTFELKVET